MLINVNRVIFRWVSALLLYDEKVEKHPGPYSDDEQHYPVAGPAAFLAQEFIRTGFSRVTEGVKLYFPQYAVCHARLVIPGQHQGRCCG